MGRRRGGLRRLPSWAGPGAGPERRPATKHTLLPSPPSASLSGPCGEQGLDQSRTQGSGLPSQQHVVLTAPIPNFHTVRPTLCQMLLCTSQQNTSKSPKACSGGLGCHVQVHDQTQRKVNIPHRLPRWLPPAAWTGPAAPTPSLLCSIVRRAASEPGGSLCPGLPHPGRPPTQQHVPKSTSPIFQPTANPEAPQQGRPLESSRITRPSYRALPLYPYEGRNLRGVRQHETCNPNLALPTPRVCLGI